MKTQVNWFSDEGLVVSKVTLSLWIYVQLYKHSRGDPEAALFPDSIKWLYLFGTMINHATLRKWQVANKISKRHKLAIHPILPSSAHNRRHRLVSFLHTAGVAGEVLFRQNIASKPTKTEYPAELKEKENDT